LFVNILLLKVKVYVLNSLYFIFALEKAHFNFAKAPRKFRFSHKGSTNFRSLQTAATIHHFYQLFSG